MPRCARIRVPQIPLHIVQRGNNRAACFFDVDDRRVYLALLKKFAARFDCAVHAYVLMSNHVHLLLTPEDADGVSLLMKHLGQCYVQYVNRTHTRTGTLWEGRYRSHPVQCYRYLLACYRYIELNPVRAAIVRHPKDYRWSSYRANAGLERSSVLNAHAEYLAIGAAAYRLTFPSHMQRPDLDEIRSASSGGRALGDGSFRAEISALTGRSMELGVRGRPPKFGSVPIFSMESGSVPDFVRTGFQG
jgi:putative transposase